MMIGYRVPYSNIITLLKIIKMLERTYKYMGCTIEQMAYTYGNRKVRYFYPSFNGNFESKNIKEVCKYIKTVLWMERIIKQ